MIHEILRNLTSSRLISGDAHTAYRDPAVLWHGGRFYLWCTLVETEAGGGVYMYTVQSESEDLVEWSTPRKLTPRDRAKNFSSPGNVVYANGRWVMCLQTYCRENGEKYGNDNCRIYTTESDDLRNWSEPKPILVKGRDLPLGDHGRMIDPYLLETADGWYCFYKQGGRIAVSHSADLDLWTPQGSIVQAENPSIVRDGELYRLFTSPRNGISQLTSTDLTRWTEVGTTTLGQSEWEWARGRITAGCVVRAEDMWLMFFHGTGPEDESVIFDTHACIGVAWSHDAVHWEWR